MTTKVLCVFGFVKVFFTIYMLEFFRSAFGVEVMELRVEVRNGVWRGCEKRKGGVCGKTGEVLVFETDMGFFGVIREMIHFLLCKVLLLLFMVYWGKIGIKE